MNRSQDSLESATRMTNGTLEFSESDQLDTFHPDKSFPKSFRVNNPATISGKRLDVSTGVIGRNYPNLPTLLVNNQEVRTSTEDMGYYPHHTHRGKNTNSVITFRNTFF